MAVVGPDGKRIAIDAEPSREEAGLIESTFIPRLPGAYRVMAKATDATGAMIGETETGWTNDSGADEFRRLTPDHEALAELAARTGGETIEAADIESFAAGLAARPAPETVQTLFPLRHAAWAFGLAVICLAGEWGLRRRRGLP